MNDLDRPGDTFESCLLISLIVVWVVILGLGALWLIYLWWGS